MTDRDLAQLSSAKNYLRYRDPFALSLEGLCVLALAVAIHAVGSLLVYWMKDSDVGLRFVIVVVEAARNIVLCTGVAVILVACARIMAERGEERPERPTRR